MVVGDAWRITSPPANRRAWCAPMTFIPVNRLRAWDPGNPNLTGLAAGRPDHTRGTPNVWSAMSYDAKLNLIYLQTGNATPDFWAENAPRWMINTAPSIVAADATTGQVRWHFQTTHHDLWTSIRLLNRCCTIHARR